MTKPVAIKKVLAILEDIASAAVLYPDGEGELDSAVPLYVVTDWIAAINRGDHEKK